MGLYDELGYEQVKCFPDAVVKFSQKWDSEDKEEILESYTLGGRLKYIRRGQKVPYKTLYYNYGTDFMIFDYRNMYNEDGFIPVHIIRNGRYFRTVDYRYIPSRYKIGLVINKYGDILKIYTKSDFIQLVQELKYYDEMYHRDYVENDKVQELFKKKCDDSDMSELTKHLEEIEKIHKEVLAKTYDIFYNNWVNLGIEDWSKYSARVILKWENVTDLEKEDIKVHGGWVIGCLLHSIQRDFYKDEEDKKRVIVEYKNKIEQKESLEDALSFYFNWCDISGIDIDKDKVKNLIVNLDMSVIDYLISYNRNHLKGW